MSPTPTSKVPAGLVFYKKEGCPPCHQASLALQYVLKINPEFEPYITVLQKEEVPELVEANNVDLYPTVLLVDDEGKEITRKVGFRNLGREWFNAALYAIYRRSTES